ncbi:type 11 methyltransferase [Nocardia sputorum]|uniref:class I SAM-dependent methyltransferase n=1 Tax=Nocardia sputorum TaxID=2984338 RepID=UPI002491BA98|nr:class I SAM-dependent methyltransferase [Nocardia sputorum]BDT92425.1 type 11 methyltransferase [Nocardia sputorum]
MATHVAGAAIRQAMYGRSDLSTISLFSGHFINFGYWTGAVSTGSITTDQRTESQASLYREVLKRADIGADDTVLEVGCGIGVGAVLALEEFDPKQIIGIDLSADQIARARRINAEVIARQSGRLAFQQGSAFVMPAEDARFDKCISIEAAQHFDDLPHFAAEANRVLKPGGVLAVATFFASAETAIRQLAPLIGTIRSGVDAVTSIGSFVTTLGSSGFECIGVETIGEHVWHGFDAWIAQTEYRDSWNRNWLNVYRDGLIDYYIVIATKPVER